MDEKGAKNAFIFDKNNISNDNLNAFYFIEGLCSMYFYHTLISSDENEAISINENLE